MEEETITINNNIKIEDIPKPNISQSTDFIEWSKNKVGVKIPRYYEEKKLIENKKTKIVYIVLFVTTLILSILTAILLFSKANVLLKILLVFLTILMLIILIMYSLIKLFIFGDFQRIKNKFIMLRSDYIRAHFFGMNKRFESRVFIPSENGREIELDKDNIYMLDSESVWIDENNIPNFFYIRGIPNPCNFEFIKYLMMYFENAQTGKSELNIKEKIDTRYSSDTLKIMKNDKFMTDMHRDKSEDIKKLYLILLGVVVAFLVFFLIYTLITNKNPQVINMLPNGTRI